MAEGSGTKYKWYILALAALTCAFVLAIPNQSMPVLFQEISEDLDLSLVQVGSIWGMTGLGAVFFVFIGGLLGDRFGVKRTISVVCFAAGIACALRGLAVSFATLAASQLLFGLMTASLTSLAFKPVSIWFPRRQMGLANSVLTISVAVGAMTGSMISATVMSPLLGGWDKVMFLYGAIAFAIGIPWLLSRSGPGWAGSVESSTETVPIRQAFSKVVHNRNLWLIGLVFLGHAACANGMRGYLPMYLRGIGWTEAGADSTLAIYAAASMVGVIPIVFLSHKLGSRKVFIGITVLMTAIGVGSLSVAVGAMVWVAVIVAGLAWDSYMSLMYTTIMETEGIGAEYTGAATGLVFTIGRLGGVISPPIGNSLAVINPSYAFVFWGALAAVMLLSCIYFIKETGSRAKRI